MIEREWQKLREKDIQLSENITEIRVPYKNFTNTGFIFFYLKPDDKRQKIMTL